MPPGAASTTTGAGAAGFGAPFWKRRRSVLDARHKAISCTSSRIAGTPRGSTV
ncbi:MAG: hypothetical protein ACK5C3_05270 [bacterium]